MSDSDKNKSDAGQQRDTGTSSYESNREGRNSEYASDQPQSEREQVAEAFAPDMEFSIEEANGDVPTSGEPDMEFSIEEANGDVPTSGEPDMEFSIEEAHGLSWNNEWIDHQTTEYNTHPQSTDKGVEVARDKVVDAVIEGISGAFGQAVSAFVEVLVAPNTAEAYPCEEMGSGFCEAQVTGDYSHVQPERSNR